MRIAIYHDLPSGGAKRTLAEMTRRLSVRHRVDAYTLSAADHAFSDIRPHVSRHRVFPFDPLPLMRSPFGRLNQAIRCADLVRLRRLCRVVAGEIDRAGYDVVFVHPCRFEQAPSVLRYLRRTRSVYYCQEPPRLAYEPMPGRAYDGATGLRRLADRVDPLPAVYREMLRAQDRRNVRRAGTVLVNSRFMARAVGEIYRVQPQVSYHGVDVEEFRPTGHAKRNFVLSVGSLTRLKGFDFLVRAMAEYPESTRPALVIASNFQNAPERRHLEALACEFKVELILRGCVGDDELVRLYNEARVVAYAPVREPFGLVPLEAMACGTPVVAVSEGGIPETVLHGRTGFLTGRDPGRFAVAIRQVVEDPALARRFGIEAREHVVREWTWERAVARLEAHLHGGAVAGSSVPALLDTQVNS